MGRIIVALGGNTLLPMDDETMAGQRRRVRAAVENLARLDEAGHDFVLTHGNGPQVGNLMLQQEQSDAGPRFPLDVLVAETQAQLGYILQQELGNVLEESVTTVITQVRVDAHDEAFEHPTKPVGPHYSESEGRSKPFQTKQVTRPDGTTTYRRVVPSPDPIEVVEADRIETLVADGKTVICAGGGGIPVVRERGQLRGVEAVIDKDRASALVADEIDATMLLLLTDVDAAYTDFGSADQAPIEEASVTELRELLADGEFAEGSMKPKVEAAIDFVESQGERAIITSTDVMDDALAGDAGTQVLP
ncbi:carbamate kinase [Halanaeroarchaeum sulfurireducens]|uniref:Carbamate kinase n=1 Tax=Halanaeroarchaeum sulfurireducens TaxID=1604004 RepID=A0A0F7PAW7_9EURY|nr:carbamate kinase [Halanaeroarchaeum sulfurireducens]AKH97290.1 carbamate kinase [Halanaeroarchaeum sulfurireducens]